MKRFLVVVLLIISQSAFGYDFKDLCREVAPSQEASKAILAVLQSLEQMQFDTETEGFMDFLRNGMDTDSFYFGDLYRSQFFKPVNDNYRALTLKHERKPGSNTIIVIPESYDDIDITACINYLGVQELGIRENPFATLKKYRSFSLYFQSKEAWENAGDISPASLADGVLKVMDPTNIRQMTPKSSCGLYPNLKDETRILVDNFSTTFPTVSSLIDQYVELNNFVLIKQTESSILDTVLNKECTGNKDVQYTHFKFTPKVKIKELKKNYPDLASNIKKYRGLFNINGVLKNTEDHIYAKLKITPKETLIEGYTADGKVIPFDEDGNLIFKEAGSFETEKEIIADGNIQVDFLGLDINISGNILINHETNENKDTLTGKIQTARYEYSGRLLGFIPISVIKFLSPIDIDRFADDMLYVMLNANNGEGTRGTIEWVKDEKHNRLSTIHVTTEMLDHYTIQFFSRYSRIFFGSSETVIEEGRMLAEKALDAVITDAKNIYAEIDYSHIDKNVGLALKD